MTCLRTSTQNCSSSQSECFHCPCDKYTQCVRRLGENIEPVVWNYAENLDEQFMMGFWEHFATPFPYMWAASAFKGLFEYTIEIKNSTQSPSRCRRTRPFLCKHSTLSTKSSIMVEAHDSRVQGIQTVPRHHSHRLAKVGRVGGSWAVMCSQIRPLCHTVRNSAHRHTVVGHQSSNTSARCI
jgi:hypothetical protein